MQNEVGISHPVEDAREHPVPDVREAQCNRFVMHAVPPPFG
jgi:hypothetical protein